jgi:hypothetical protein
VVLPRRYARGFHLHSTMLKILKTVLKKAARRENGSWVSLNPRIESRFKEGVNF